VVVRVALVLESPWRPACIPVFAGIDGLPHHDVGDAGFIADEHHDAAGLAPEGKSPAMPLAAIVDALGELYYT
jgi:hypothetical protein